MCESKKRARGASALARSLRGRQGRGLSKSGGFTVIVFRPSESARALACSPIAVVILSTLMRDRSGVGASGVVTIPPAATSRASAWPAVRAG